MVVRQRQVYPSYLDLLEKKETKQAILQQTKLKILLSQRASLLYLTTQTEKTQCTEFHTMLKKKKEFIFLLFTIMYLICEGLFSTILFCKLLSLIAFRYSFLSNAIKLDKPSLFPSPVSDSLFSSHAFSVT